MFSSGRVKLIPFDRHFSPEEQDAGLKKLFRRRDSMSGILNWMIEGYRLLQAEGLTMPARVTSAIAAYRQEADIFGAFLCEYSVEQSDARTPTSELYYHYTGWAKENGYRQMNSKNFVAELRRRYDVRRDGTKGNVVVGLTIDLEPHPF